MKRTYLLLTVLSMLLFCSYSNTNSQNNSKYSLVPFQYSLKSATSIFDEAPNLRLNKITIENTDIQVDNYTDNNSECYYYALETGYLPNGDIDDWNDAYYNPETGIYDVIFDLTGIPDNVSLYPIVSDLYNCQFLRPIPEGIRLYLSYKDDPNFNYTQFYVKLVDELNFNKCYMIINVKYLRMHPLSKN